MPLRCVEERRSPTQLDSEEEDSGDCTCIWQETPDSILLHVFSFLALEDLAVAAQTCKKWNRISYDECLWKAILRQILKSPDCTLAPGKPSWRSEVVRVLCHTPTVLTETLEEHTDEVLHVSFSHDGTLFSTTSKDATLKVWTVGHPTTLKYHKDFRELLGWDFTQFSCFNGSDTMILVSSVKASSYMDRRGFMAILSLVHDFEILRVVTMDPSQLFGAWLDDTTFLGGSLEISLDRFATTVQIEAYDVPNILSPIIPRLSPTPIVEESSGKPLFTFSSESASLIKFLTVADILAQDQNVSGESASVSSFGESSVSRESSLESVHLTQLSPNRHTCRVNEPCCPESVSLIQPSPSVDYNFKSCPENEPSCSHASSPKLASPSNTLKDSCDDFNLKPSFSKPAVADSHCRESSVDSLTHKVDRDDFHSKLDTSAITSISESERNCDTCQNSFRTFKKSDKNCDKCRDTSMKYSSSETAIEIENQSTERDMHSSEAKPDITGAETDVIMASSSHQNESVLEKMLTQRPITLDTSGFGRSDGRKISSKTTSNLESQNIGHSSSRATGTNKTSKLKSVSQKRQELNVREKNLIFVTGEFAVALHQLGFKNLTPYTKESVLARGVTPMEEDNEDGFMVVNYSNNDIHIVQRQQETDRPDHLIDLFGHVTGLCLSADQRGEFAVALHQLGFKNLTPYTKESVLARGVTPMEEDNEDGFMVVNYSNNDIHIVQRQQETDRPDHLIDLFGHVTGLCLSADQRFLFINCRPWIGDVDRTDPWATPDLSPNIEVRIIDLVSLKDLGAHYVGHKGFSPSNMCCFVFLDVSEDYVASGSEDAKGYLWDRHYRSLLANYDHDNGVVNAVAFNPQNQEFFVTVSDDGLVKVWRSKREVKRLNLTPFV